MASLTTQEVLSSLKQNPDNDELREQLKARIIAKDPELNDAAHNLWSTLASIPVAIGAGVASIVDNVERKLGFILSWTNCINQQLCTPIEIRQPKNLQDLIDAIAIARSKNLSIRAVGSGHSFSDVAAPFNGGILLKPQGMNKVLSIDSNLLLNPSQAKMLFSVESGITIKDLNTELDNRGLALANMGAYDGQTLSGAISTGTHGTGITLGPIASSVRALVLVTEDGTVYQIEPAKGITDPAKFQANNASITLKQDDDWFYSTVIAMGSMGIIYSYILEVQPSYFLKENRSLTTWEQVKQDLVFTPGGGIPQVLLDNRHYEVDINPYTVNNQHSCIVEIKNLDPGPPHGSRGFADWVTTILAGWPTAEKWFVWFLNEFPWTSPEAINSALSSLVDANYVDKSFKVLSVGAVDNLQALAMEISFPADETLIESIDNLLETFATEKKIGYLAGPVALRFVASSPAYLAPQSGRLTCMAELDMLVGITTGETLLKTVVSKVLQANPKARIHWGLDLDTVTEQQVSARYEEYPKWLKVYQTLNSKGIFNNRFTDRIGISIGAQIKEKAA
jgi:hypothetical protein